MTQLSHRGKNLALVMAVALGLWAFVGGMVGSAHGDGARHSIEGDLFYNFYVPPVGEGSVGAEMYPCPRPTPPLVGHTYVTYQPLMPHEMMYRHHRHYKTFHQDAPPTRTEVRWNRCCLPGLF